VDFHSLHTIHGRALTFATGVKLAKTGITAIVPMGDGDALAIGGNHFIHAARRNIDITAIVMNNRIYGMTGGQFSPLSGIGKKATTAPYSTIDNQFDVVELAKSAGASFVARSTVFHAIECKDLLKKAISHKGFSVVEMNMGQVVTQVKSAVDNPHNVFLANRIDGQLISPTDIKTILRMIQGKGV
jgi:2-oxoglutarate ferredoxin oxidoreductase subunit beta